MVLITGASSGLGLAISKTLIREDQYILVLTAKKQSLKRFHDDMLASNKHVLVRELDMVDHNQIVHLVTELNREFGGVDVLINNAGIAESSSVEDSDDLYRQQQLDVNYLGPFAIISCVLARMRQKRWGRIVNISSAGGFMAMPTMSSYSASKFALEAATEALWYEVKPWGIKVTLVIPGCINSLGYKNTRRTIKSAGLLSNRNSPYVDLYRYMASLIEYQMKWTHMTNDRLALKISAIVGSENPPLRVHVTLDSLGLYWFRKLCPAFLYHHLIYGLLPKVAVDDVGKFHSKIESANPAGES